ncbi:MAG: hypothetical protein ACUZ8O_03670 [Candidatus Anammoxibacter sp.]
MIAIILLAILLAMMIYCIAIIILKLCNNTTWYKVGFVVPAWILFLFLVIEAMIYMDHKNDFKTLSEYSKITNELNEKGSLAGTVLSFVISKYPEHNDIKINEIKTIDGFFQNYPDLNVEEVKNTLPDYLEIKNNLESIKTKSETIEDRILYRSNSPWVLILPKQTLY